ncbi:MAG: bifunctional phosphopantothenoylcysteine decarboxylase/phosphopantothenate--cysteine ligase CoaBC [Acidobacteriaceae bacterium]
MKIALGVCGGIAAYKAAEICRLLQERGLSVQVVMTQAAQEFVRPLTFAALSGNKVITGLFGGEGEPNLDSAVEHIGVAQGIDALLVAPATADMLAKFAHGLANDFLSTLYLATTAPVILAPAMNVNMWQHPATLANLEELRGRGHSIVAPGAGYLACGMVGAGRLAENELIVEAVLATLDARIQSSSFERKHDLEGETVLITAGATREPIDPVRFIGNRSSGKMGFAIAASAKQRGAQVVLIAGVTTVPPPSGVELVRVERTEEMRSAVLKHFQKASIVIKAAAVADYRPKAIAEQKMKRQGTGSVTLELEPTADILGEISRLRTRQIIVGFAAETEHVLENARQKLTAKMLDAIVVNDVSQPGIGFESDENAVTIVTRAGEEQVPRMSKRKVAERVLDAVVELMRSRAGVS